MSEFFQIEMKDAKKEITKIFYGCNPKKDVPFLWKLKDETEEAIDLFLDLEEN